MGLLPDSLTRVSPVAEFVQVPISSVRSAVTSLKEFLGHAISLFSEVFALFFGTTSFKSIATALLLSVMAGLAFIAYVAVAAVSLLFSLAVILVGFLVTLVGLIF